MICRLEDDVMPNEPVASTQLPNTEFSRHCRPGEGTRDEGLSKPLEWTCHPQMTQRALENGTYIGTDVCQVRTTSLGELTSFYKHDLGSVLQLMQRSHRLKRLHASSVVVEDTASLDIA